MAEMGIGKYLVALAIEIPVFFLILALIEYEGNTRKISFLFDKYVKSYLRKISNVICGSKQSYQEGADALMGDEPSEYADDDIVNLHKELMNETK